MIRQIPILFLILLISARAFAYVFDFRNSRVAPFFRATAADTQQSSQAYSGTSGSDTDFSEGVQFGFSGELGVQFNINSDFSFRVGAEGYQGKSIDAIGTLNSNGSQLMTVNSLATVINPNAGIQYNMLSSDRGGRIYLLLDGGYAMATVANDDSLTSAGQSEYGASGVTNVNEKWNGDTISYVAGVGAEYHAFSNTTIGLEAGYRQMQFNKFTYANSGHAIRGSGSSAYQQVSSGSVVTDNSGARVSLNMSGLFLGVVLRFYIPSE